MQFIMPGAQGSKRARAYRFAIILAIVLFLVVAPEVQEGNSMNPTVDDGQVVVVSKSIITGYSAKRSVPDRDKLVILEKAYCLDAGLEDNLITRVIAVPGDTVEIKDGKVLVNDKEYITDSGIDGAKGKYKKTKLKGNQIFVLSDNRSSDKFEKCDSRNPKLGLVDMREIKGNVLLRVWPLNKFSLMINK